MQTLLGSRWKFLLYHTVLPFNSSLTEVAIRDKTLMSGELYSPIASFVYILCAISLLVCMANKQKKTHNGAFILLKSMISLTRNDLQMIL